jgi:hypothetical protein
MLESVSDEPLHLPLIPHRKTGVLCDGFILATQDGEQITLKCDKCGAIVGTVNAEVLKAWEQAIADRIVIHKFDELDALEVLSTVSKECQRGECRNCPGTFSLADEMVFCVHECHKVEGISNSVN